MTVGLEPDVAPYQCLRGGLAGNNGEKDVTKNTFEAGMCLKTNKYLTKCPIKIRTFMSKIRTFSSNRHDFCRKKPLSLLEPGRSALGAGRPLEMLNIKIEPTMCMKTQKTVTKCHAETTVFCGIMRRMSGNRRISVQKKLPRSTLVADGGAGSSIRAASARAPTTSGGLR
jgi:hypothetical protein